MMIKKEVFLRGSIRALVGFMVVFGAVGGMDNGSDLFVCVVLAVVGLVTMFSGVMAMKEIK